MKFKLMLPLGGSPSSVNVTRTSVPANLAPKVHTFGNVVNDPQSDDVVPALADRTVMPGVEVLIYQAPVPCHDTTKTVLVVMSVGICVLLPYVPVGPPLRFGKPLSSIVEGQFGVAVSNDALVPIPSAIFLKMPPAVDTPRFILPVTALFPCEPPAHTGATAATNEAARAAMTNPKTRNLSSDDTVATATGRR